MVLGHSRDSFCALTGSQDLVTFWACHRAAFTHFGGVPRELLYDRTKTVVRRTSAGKWRSSERVFHPRRWPRRTTTGSRCGSVSAYRAKTKGKVEPDVPYVRERLLRGHSFTSYEQANIGVGGWNEEIARQRKHGTHGEIVAVRAERDRAALLPLPRDLLPGRRAHDARRGARRVLQLRGPPLRVPDAKPGERVELVLGATELEVHSLRRRPPVWRGTTRPPATRAARPGRGLGVARAGARRAPGPRGSPPTARSLPGGDRWVS